MSLFESLESRTFMSVSPAVLVGPMTVGYQTTWKDTTNGANARTHVTTVIGAAKLNGVKTTRIDTTQSIAGNNATTTQYFFIDNTTGWQIPQIDFISKSSSMTATGKSVFAVKHILAPKALDAGKVYTFKWTETRTNTFNGGSATTTKESVVYTVKLNSEKLSSVTVPAGTFKCYTLSTTLVTTGSGYTTTAKNTQYTSPGVGFVKVVQNLTSSYAPKVTQVEQSVLTKIVKGR